MRKGFVDSCWYVFYSTSVGWVVAWAMNVLECIGFCSGLVGILSQVQCDIQEVNNFVSVDGNVSTLSLSKRQISFLMFSVALGSRCL